MKGVRNGIENKPRVRYFDLGDRTWHAAPSWQSVTTRNQTMYLSAHRSGSATLSPNDGTLADAVPTGRDSYQDSSVYNPAAGASIPADKDGPDGFLPFVPLDQRLDEPFGLTFTGPELKQPLPLAGPSELRFWTIIEDTDMPYIARLIDVAPDGSSRLVTQGWLRASYRYVDPARSRPGKPYLPDDRQDRVTIALPTEYRMDIWDTAYTLEPGHRLRLWLSFSDTPTHEPLPVAGRIFLLHDRDHPSQLILGTRLPGAAAPAAKGAPVKCARRARILARVPKSLRRARVTVDGRRARIVSRGRARVVVIKPRAGARAVTVRIRGVDRHGRAVRLHRHYRPTRPCR